MPVAFLLDENLPSRLLRAIQRHNAKQLHPIDVVRVGEPPDLPLGANDATILAWAERESRILVTRDKQSMGSFFANHLATGGHSPGVFIIKPTAKTQEVVEFLMLAAHVSDASEWTDRIEFIP